MRLKSAYLLSASYLGQGGSQSMSVDSFLRPINSDSLVWESYVVRLKYLHINNRYVYFPCARHYVTTFIYLSYLILSTS